ncbi:MAG: enoyl-CoA hydratase/isomerase family protein [Bdellovibrionales bacterium]|nr:enoyl-CoA hydratase/isomerase family protein [Bdellovibrionales bacterium]
MVESGTLQTSLQNGVGTITFSHPKGNSLPGELLRQIASQIDTFGSDDSVRILLLQSEGERAFCAGASFDELLAVSTLEESREFFSGFAKVILAIRRCPKFVVARVQGKFVGGGVGVISACDYALATESALGKLSEIALGFGPFIIGPAVERKIGKAAFSAMGIDAEWKDALWCKEQGLFAEVYPDITSLDKALGELLSKLSEYNPEAIARMKEILWEGTEHWEKLLSDRVEITANLAISEFVQAKVSSFKAQ